MGMREEFAQNLGASPFNEDLGMDTTFTKIHLVDKIKSNLKEPTLDQVLEFLLQLGERLVHLVPLLLLHQKRVSTRVHQPIIWKPIGNYRMFSKYDSSSPTLQACEVTKIKTLNSKISAKPVKT